MKRYKNLLMAGLVATTLLSSCGKDFLDQAPNDQINTGEALLSDSDVLAALNGTYSGLQATDLYGRTLFVIGDMLAENTFVSQENAGRYLNYEAFNFARTNSEISGIWTNAYEVIMRTNNIINSEQTTINNQEDVDQYKGEAYAIRALMYFELVRHFARPYTDDPSALGVPIVLETELFATPERNTVAEVYEQILSDLEKAYTLMSQYRGSGFMSKYAARALAAKVNLYKGTEEGNRLALEYAEEVINESGFKLLQLEDVVPYWASGATTTNKYETLFEVVFTEIDNNGSDELADIYSQQGGYGDILTTEEVYDLYDEDDVRKDLIIVGSRESGEDPAYIIDKFPNVTGDRDDRVVIRMSEVYLIAAEAAYRLGDEATALEYLNALVEERDPTLEYTSSGAQLLADIILERRKELAFEGERYHTLNRLMVEVTDRPEAPFDVPYSDYRRVFPIPQSEVDANKNITQNEGWE